MSKIHRFTAPASQDIESILDYIADNSSFEAAERFLSKLNQKCSNLATFPNLGRKRNELYPSLRSFPIDGYLIFYRLIEDGIEIMRVVSGNRDLDALFKDSQ
jgi:toxin ParE1/3/4